MKTRPVPVVIFHDETKTNVQQTDIRMLNVPFRIFTVVTINF